MLLIVLYAVNAAFAYSYNVGDTHVFYLPSHLMVALAMAPGIVAIGNCVAFPWRAQPRVAGAVMAATASIAIAYAGARMYDDFPALDRRADGRPLRVLSALTAALDDRHAVLLTDLNWQVQNGLSYFTRAVRPEIAVARMPDVLLYAPALIHDNLTAGRNVVVTARAANELTAAYGPLFRVEADPRVVVDSPAAIARRVPAGTRYVLCMLRPSRDLPLAPAEAVDAARALGAARHVRVARRRLFRRGRRRRPEPCACDWVRSSIPSSHRARWCAGGHPDGVVAGGRHDSSDGVRADRRRTSAHTHRRAWAEFRGIRRPRRSAGYRL